jgi:type I restriction enzyme S subunit
MPGKWRTARIEEIAERVAMGPFGSSIKVETFVTAGVPVVSGQHLHGFKLEDSVGFNFITEEHADRLKNANVQHGDIVRPFFTRASAAARESRTLATLRDALLPKLLSGEIRVKVA